jgi:hypothetical protein
LPRGAGLFDRKSVFLTSLFHDKNTGITSLKPQAFCRIQPEPAMTATISPEIVQLALG